MAADSPALTELLPARRAPGKTSGSRLRISSQAFTDLVATHPAAGISTIAAGHSQDGCGIAARFATVATRTNTETIIPCSATDRVAKRAARYAPVPAASTQPLRRSAKAEAGSAAIARRRLS